jgi:hypothetical protein
MPFAKREISQKCAGYRAISVTSVQEKVLIRGQMFSALALSSSRDFILQREVSHEDKHRLREELTVQFLSER